MGSISAVLADAVARGDISIIFLVVALVCLCGAAYLAYLRNVAGALLLLLIAVIAFVLA